MPSAADNLAKLQSKFAEIAQLVEHNLAKVGVASPSLVFRSREIHPMMSLFFLFQ